MIIEPIKEVIVSSGNVYYSESQGAWNTLRFKKDLLTEFPQLRNKRFKTKYRAVIFHSLELLLKEVEAIVKRKSPLPVLLFFEQEI